MNREKILLTMPESWEGLHTSYIQEALDRCRFQGGEVVLLDGEWHSGSVRMYSNTTLRLSAGTVLIASDKMEDYENFHVPSTLGYLKSPWVIEAWHLAEHYILAPIVAFDAENVIVRNCRLNTACNTFRFGGKNLLVENCRFWGPGEYPHRISGRHNTLCAFLYYAMCYDDIRVDSENWLIRNCTMENLDCLFDYRYGADFPHNARPLRDVTFENVTMTGFVKPAVFNPVPGNALTVTMRNVTMSRREGVHMERMFLTSPDVKLILENTQIDGLNA